MKELDKNAKIETKCLHAGYTPEMVIHGSTNCAEHDLLL